MIERVASGVLRFATRTPTLPPATHTNSYLLEGGGEALLVEPASPYPDEQRAFLEWVRAQDRARPLAIVATHHHPDHIGGAVVYAEQLGLPLWAHERTAALLPGLSFARHLRDGEQVRLGESTWHVLHTPGHASGHVCLHDADNGTLIVGDMVASIGTILIPPDDGDMGEYLRQLERLALLDARRALPAHGDPIDDPSVLFRAYVAHRLAREAKVVQALAGSERGGAVDAERDAGRGAPITLEALLPTVYGDVAPEALPFALLSLRAHVDKLVRDGRVVESHDGHVRLA